MAKSKYNLTAWQIWAEHHTSTWWQRALVLWRDVDIGPRPVVKMNPRLTATAGRAFLHPEMKDQYIDLSCYLSEKYPVDMQEDTIPHELAHIIAWRLYKARGHCATWKQTAIRLYGKCDRTHKY